MIEIPVKLRSVEDLFDPFDPAPASSRRLADGAVSNMLAKLKGSTSPGPVVVSLLLASSSPGDEDAALRAAVPAHFQRMTDVATSEINRMKLITRVFVPVGFVIMALCTFMSEFLIISSERQLAHSIAEGILVLGWVALWAPFEYLLFNRLPVIRERSYYRQLAAAEVKVQHTP